jgi:hypothetical protein
MPDNPMTEEALIQAIQPVLDKGLPEARGEDGSRWILTNADFVRFKTDVLSKPLP